jgi:hypothetical protein
VRFSSIATTLLLVVALLIAATRAGAADRNLAGSAQLDYHFVPTEGASTPREAAGQYDFDGFTVEAAQKLAVDVTDHLSAQSKLCFGCHGFALDMAYFDYRVVDEFNVRAGRFSPSFGSFIVRHDVANHKFSDQPLPYDMGHMLRLRSWNLGVVPNPFPDNGVEINGTHWFGDSVQFDYAVYAVMGFKSKDPHPVDIDFALSHEEFFTDVNARPTGGGRLALTGRLGDTADLTIGASGQYGPYDPKGQLFYTLVGADLSLHVNHTNLRMEYLFRRTDMDTTGPQTFAYTTPASGRDFFLKHGAYAEFEQALSPDVDILLRVDGLYRIGNYRTSDALGMPLLSPITLSRNSSVLRYALGGSYAFEPAFRIKISVELWQFSDKDPNGRTLDVGTHLSLVGTY